MDRTRICNVQIDTKSYAVLNQIILSSTSLWPGVLSEFGTHYAILGCATCDDDENAAPWGGGAPRTNFYVSWLRNDSSDGESLIKLKLKDAAHVSISADGSMLALLPPELGGTTALLTLLDTRTGRVLKEVEVESGHHVDMKFSIDGNFLYLLHSVSGMPTLVKIGIDTGEAAAIRLPRANSIIDVSNEASIFLQGRNSGEWAARNRASIYIIDSKRGTVAAHIPLIDGYGYRLNEFAWNLADDIRKRFPWMGPRYESVQPIARLAGF